MKNLILSFILILGNNSFAATQPLKYSLEFILEQVLTKSGKTLDSQIPLPELRLASQTKLEDFQNDVKDQWGMAPDLVTNVYVAAKNRIYLLDDAEYYKKTKRCIDDSLAHELHHYVQVHYKNIPIEHFDDSMEWEAVEVQTWFRENFCQP